jgi:hypothetical protein
MKVLIYLSLIAILILSGCAKNDDESSVRTGVDQLKSVPENGTVSYNFYWGYWADLFCDDEYMGYLSGPVDWHVRDHYKDGELEWSIYNASGSLEGPNGEIFTIHESDKIYYSQPDWTFHCNLLGDQGSHYILSGHGDPVTYQVFVDRANCPGQ